MLKQVKNEIDNHVSNIKLAIEQDPHLSGDISASELKTRIDDLKQKNEEFNQIKNLPQNKTRDKKLEELIFKCIDTEDHNQNVQSIVQNAINPETTLVLFVHLAIFGSGTLQVSNGICHFSFPP